MARANLLAGAVAWSLAFGIGLGVAVVGADALVAILPPLAIDTDAVRGAATAVAGVLAVGALAHVLVLAGMRGRRRRAWSAAILLCALLLAVFVALGAAAFTSAATNPDSAGQLVIAGLAAMLIAVAYGLATARLVSEMRSGSVS